VPQGCCDAALFFQQTMETVFEDLLHQNLLVWIDDLLLHAGDIEAYLHKLENMFDLMAEYGLTAQDVFPSGSSAKSSGAKPVNKVAPKFRDPATGQTWTGRGKAPKWIEGQDRAKFLIA
jgi:DNA-binding protein H-NS